MSIQSKVDIFNILNMFNESVGYKGLDNTGKKTDERDDVISRQTFNNWLRVYNSTHLDRQIKSKKVNQYQNEWFKNDIEKLIQDKKVQKNLKQAYLRNTVPLFEEFESIGFLSSQRVSKKYKEAQNKLREQGNSGALDESIEITINQLIEEVLEEHFSLFFRGKKISGHCYINRSKLFEDFIDEKKIEEEAFRVIENYYGTTEYDEQGEIIEVHNYIKRPKTDYYLK